MIGFRKNMILGENRDPCMHNLCRAAFTILFYLELNPTHMLFFILSHPKIKLHNIEMMIIISILPFWILYTPDHQQ